MKKPLPILKTDKEAEAFIENADLTDYDLSALKQVRFEFQPKDKRVTMRISDNLFSAIKAKAEKLNIPYQRFIRMQLEESVK
ncbi:MAG: CopG family antitoxin [Chryseobacterium sp.]